MRSDTLQIYKIFQQLLLPVACALMFMLTFVSCTKNDTTKAPETTAEQEEKPVAKKPKLTGKLKFTYMAKCQMRCGHYRTSVIREAFKSGSIVTRERWLKRKPCPFYAVNHKHSNGDPLTIVIAVCENDDVIKVVRVFNKNMKQCDCKNKKSQKAS